ncbi:MAG: AMP-binding protein [Candidatus Wallbacteria bacterium]|nr:AMP-binding protein [Candidatus Wallbacteria bacterium]
MTAAGETVNVATYLPQRARETPFKRAVVFPAGRDAAGRVTYSHLTFSQLDLEADRLARGFLKLGLGRGVRTAMLVRPSLEFVAIAFALFKVGAVPVFVDPGMGRKAMLACFREAAPAGFIGIARAHLMRLLFPSAFRSVRIPIVAGGWAPGALPLARVREEGDSPVPVAATTAAETAAIFFTSGSTGVPKGVPFTHGMIQGQVSIQQRAYGIGPDEIDLTAFPVFVLFSTAWGATAVIPDMDPTRPAQVDPARIVEAIRNQGVTHTFGSPAIWNRVGRWCDERQVTLPSVRRILMAGAPVPGKLLELWKRILPNGEVHTPYGATECLGVATISASEVVGETWAMSREGAGTCVGRPLPETRVRILKITDEPLALGSEGWAALEVPPGEVGEIAVSGTLAAREYLERPDHTRLSKIAEEGTIWHRMGDLGYLDGQGRIWFCGRKAHRVTRGGVTLFSVRIEGQFNGLAGVYRTALVGVPSPLGQAAVLVVEPEPDVARDRAEWARELLERARQRSIPLDHVLFHPSFPVDVRHNAKIRREDLAVWAREELRKR